MHLVIFLLIPLSFVVALPTVWAVRHLSRRLGHLDGKAASGALNSGLRHIPNTGGIGIVAGIIVPTLAGLALLYALGSESSGRLSVGLGQQYAGIMLRVPMLLGLLGCLLALHVVGLWDDRRPMSAAPKLIVQVVAATALVYWSDSRLLTMLDDVAILSPVAPWPSIIASVLWLVIVTNAINFMDNMDGLAAGVAAIASALFLVAALLNGQWFIAAMLALLVGSLLAFLIFNFPPASIFMGDGGSLVVGFLLGFLTIRTTYFDPQIDQSSGWYGVFMPLIVLAIPIYDFCSVMVIRLSQRRHPWAGDEQHFSHRIVKRGLSRRMAVLLIYGCTLVTGIGGISLGRLLWWQACLVGIQTLAILGMLAIYEHAAQRSANDRSDATDSAACGQGPGA